MNEPFRSRRRSSVRTRLTIAVGLIAACFLGATAWLFVSVAGDQVIASARDDQVVFAESAFGDPIVPGTGIRAQEAADLYEELVEIQRAEDLYALLGVPAPEAGVGVMFTDAYGDVVTVQGLPEDPNGTWFDANTMYDAASLLLAGVSPSELVIVGDTTAGVTSVGPFVPASEISAFIAPIELENVDASVGDLSRGLWLAAGALTVLAIAATWLLAGRILRPVELITRRVEAIGAAGSGSGDRVPVPDTRDEIGHLAVTMNGMLERLDHAADTQRRFAADASHELRSPLAVIRTEAEVALAHPDQAEWPTITRNILAETNRLEGLVADLLTLARQDQSGPAVRFAPEVDVDEVVMHETARTRRVPVDASRVLAGRVRAESADVGRMVRHLLDNAARHAESRVEVSLTTERSGALHEVVLRVDDDGAGVPAADRETIFERFARLQDSRSRDEGGAGLGLAVVASVVTRLGGTVTVADATLGGARFEVRLPALPDD